MTAQRLVVYMGDIKTTAKSESSLLREIQARCRDLTVNQWLGEFDPHTRSKELLLAYCVMVAQQTLTLLV